ncbi:MAG TPA: glycosyltransferase [Gemmatimonadaceae bacterium]|nr:glycosyltransferase [Gemmatimonadaceae bacterium]
MASVDAAATIRACLESVAASCAHIEHEVIVVDSSRDDSAAIASRALPGATIVRHGSGLLVPHLWAAGIESARGDVVALTTANFRVSGGWAGALLSALGESVVGVGGPIALADDVSITDAAVFFLRYSAYLQSRSRSVSEARDFAGDNCCYLRAALNDGTWSVEHGFWETEENAALRKAGSRLVMNPDAKAIFLGGMTLGAFSRQRYAHAVLFGEWRARVNGESRARMIAVSPLVPFILSLRIAKRAWQMSEYRSRLLGCMPVLLWLAACWAAGEAMGALRSGSRASKRLAAV